MMLESVVEHEHVTAEDPAARSPATLRSGPTTTGTPGASPASSSSSTLAHGGVNVTAVADDDQRGRERRPWHGSRSPCDARGRAAATRSTRGRRLGRSPTARLPTLSTRQPTRDGAAHRVDTARGAHVQQSRRATPALPAASARAAAPAYRGDARPRQPHALSAPPQGERVGGNRGPQGAQRRDRGEATAPLTASIRRACAARRAAMMRGERRTAASPRARADAGSRSNDDAARARPHRTTAPASTRSRRSAASRTFASCGPKTTGRPACAGSSRLWPSTGTSVPPTKASVAEAYTAPRSPIPSSSRTSPAASGALGSAERNTTRRPVARAAAATSSARAGCRGASTSAQSSPAASARANAVSATSSSPACVLPATKSAIPPNARERSSASLGGADGASSFRSPVTCTRACRRRALRSGAHPLQRTPTTARRTSVGRSSVASAR